MGLYLGSVMMIGMLGTISLFQPFATGSAVEPLRPVQLLLNVLDRIIFEVDQNQRRIFELLRYEIGVSIESSIWRQIARVKVFG